MIALDLLRVFVGVLLLFAALGVGVAAVEWCQRRTTYRHLPPPPLSNDDRIRAYQINERAHRALR